MKALYADKLAGGISILLIGAMLYTLTDTVSYIVTGDTPVGASPPSTQLSQHVQPTLDELVALQMFGVADVAASIAPEEQAPTTSLALTLEGIFEARDPDRSVAILAESGRPPGSYRVGSSIPGNAVLARVESDRVLLKRGAGFESLAFPEANSRTRPDVASPMPENEPDTSYAGPMPEIGPDGAYVSPQEADEEPTSES